MELTPARPCMRCGLVGTGEEVCSGCGAKFHSQEQETALNSNGVLLDNNPSLTPPEFQNPFKPDETPSSADYRSDSAILPFDNGVKTGALDSIPPWDIFDEP